MCVSENKSTILFPPKLKKIARQNFQISKGDVIWVEQLRLNLDNSLWHKKNDIKMIVFSSTHYKYSIQANIISKFQGYDVFLEINFLLFFNIKVMSCFEIL